MIERRGGTTQFSNRWRPVEPVGEIPHCRICSAPCKRLLHALRTPLYSIGEHGDSTGKVERVLFGNHIRKPRCFPVAQRTGTFVPLPTPTRGRRMPARKKRPGGVAVNQPGSTPRQHQRHFVRGRLTSAAFLFGQTLPTSKRFVDLVTNSCLGRPSPFDASMACPSKRQPSKPHSLSSPERLVEATPSSFNLSQYHLALFLRTGNPIL
jgi:hypothetical protein